MIYIHSDELSKSSKYVLWFHNYNRLDWEER